MTTRWIDYTSPDPVTVLCVDGTILQEPALEITESGRKLRLKDNPSMSCFYSRQREWMSRVMFWAAEQRNTHVWFSMSNAAHLSKPDPTVRAVIPADEPLFVDNGNRYEPNLCALTWRFEHGTLPLFAAINLVLKQLNNGEVSVTLTVTFTDTDPALGYSYPVLHESEPWDSSTTDATKVLSHLYTRWDKTVSECFAEPTARLPYAAAMRQAARMARVFDGLSTFPIPDLRGNGRPELIFLDLRATNVTEGVIARLVEGGSADVVAKSLVEAYDTFRDALARAGMVLPDRTATDLGRIVLGRDPLVEVDLIATQAKSALHKHALYLDLVNGRLGLACEHQSAEVLADRWEEAHTIAELTNQQARWDDFTDKFLAQKARGS